MFDIKELINDLFKHNSCHLCCNNKKERDPIIITAKRNKVYDSSKLKSTITEKKNFCENEVKTELEQLMLFNQSSSSSSSRRYPIPRQPLTS